MKLDRHQGMTVPFGSFSPDADPLTPGVVLNTINAIPTMAGFRSLPGPEPLSNVLPGEPLGATYTVYSSGTARTVAGTRDHLYELQNGLWVEIDNGQTFVALSRWHFARFGDDLIAVANNVAPQVATGPAGTFLPLGGDPPFGAEFAVAVGGFVLMAKGTEWFSSAAGADNDWVPNIQTLAAEGIFYDEPGPVTALSNILRTLVAFKNKAMWIGRESGPPETWDMQLISTATGTWCQECVIPAHDQLLFLGSDDFYACSGYTPQPIPNQLKQWFFRTADPNRMAEISSRFDYKDSVAWWYFPTLHAPVHETDFYIAYNTRSQRWAAGPHNISFAVGTTGV